MKVVYLNPTGQLGGAEKVLLDTLASLIAADAEFQPHLIAASDGPLVSRAKALGVPVTVLPFSPALARLGDGGAGGPAGRHVGSLALLGRLAKACGATAVYLRQLHRKLKRLSPDIIHTNGFKMHLLGLWARPDNTRVVWHVHDYISARPLMARALPRFAKRCAAIIAVSNSVAEDVRKVCGQSAPVHTVYNAIDLDRYSLDGPRLDLDELAGMSPAPAGTVRVGMFATMARWKGHEVFLNALSQLPADLPIRAYVVGGQLYQTDGSQYSIDELRRMAADLGIAGRVGFTGFVEDSASGMRACDIIVHASTQPEPFGLVIVEGMACGRAVIVSKAGGAAELVTENESALVFSPGKAKELTARIGELANNQTLRFRVGTMGNAIAHRLFNRARLSSQLMPLYRNLSDKSSIHAFNSVSLSEQ